MTTRSFAEVFVSALILAMALGSIPAAEARSGGSNAASITGTIYTIDVAKKNVTIKTDVGTSVKLAIGRSTLITRNGVPSSLPGLTLHDSITGQYRVSRLTATVLTASGPAVTAASGKASSVSSASGALSIGSQQLQTNANTRISRNGQIVALRKITLSDSLVAHVAMGTNVALDVLADGPDESEVQGIISAIVGSNVTITPDDGSAAVTIVVGTGTVIEVNDTAGTLADLQVGQAVDAEYDPTTLVAFSIDVNNESEEVEVQGTVAGVDTTAGTVTIAPLGGGPNITLVVNASTEIEVNGEGATLADIQIGMPIQAEYDSATLVATQIEAGGADD